MREFNPVYDKMHFDLGFPKGMRPYVVALRRDAPSPLDQRLQRNELKDARPATIPQVTIDVDGIEDRIEPFPVPEGIYEQISAVNGKVLFTSLPWKAASISRSSIRAKSRKPKRSSKHSTWKQKNWKRGSDGLPASR